MARKNEGWRGLAWRRDGEKCCIYRMWRYIISLSYQNMLFGDGSNKNGMAWQQRSSTCGINGVAAALHVKKAEEQNNAVLRVITLPLSLSHHNIMATACDGARSRRRGDVEYPVGGRRGRTLARIKLS